MTYVEPKFTPEKTEVIIGSNVRTTGADQRSRYDRDLVEYPKYSYSNLTVNVNDACSNQPYYFMKLQIGCRI